MKFQNHLIWEHDPEGLKRLSCEILEPLFDVAYMEGLTHRAALACVIYWESQGPPLAHMAARKLEALEARDDMRDYFDNTNDAIEVLGTMVRIYVAGNEPQKAADMTMRAGTRNHAIGAQERALSDFDHHFTFLYQVGKRDEAQRTFKRLKEQGIVPWRNIYQRPSHFFTPLKGVPYPIDPSDGTPSKPQLPTVVKILENWDAIMQEFNSLMATRPSAFKDILSDDVSLTKDRDPDGWRRLVFNDHSRWNDTACGMMPTVCALLRDDLAVDGVIPPRKVQALNEGGGWEVSADNEEWLHEGHSGKRATLDPTTLIANQGHIPDQTVSILRLAPGSRLHAHCGSTNARLNIHFGLVIPPKCKIRVADELRDWEVGKPLIFDESFEHEVWNDSSEPRFILQAHVWHPGFMRLVEEGTDEPDEPEGARGGPGGPEGPATTPPRGREEL